MQFPMTEIYDISFFKTQILGFHALLIYSKLYYNIKHEGLI